MGLLRVWREKSGVELNKEWGELGEDLGGTDEQMNIQQGTRK